MRQTYTGPHQALHWLTLGLFLVQLWTYPAIGRSHHAPHFGLPIDPWDLVLHKVHTIAGVSILLFTLLRLWIRYRNPVSPPSVPGRFLPWLSGMTHAALYAVLILLPITGLLKAYFLSGAGPIHILLTRALYGLLAIHVAAALIHALFWRDRSMARMGIRLPFRR